MLNLLHKAIHFAKTPQPTLGSLISDEPFGVSDIKKVIKIYSTKEDFRILVELFDSRFSFLKYHLHDDMMIIEDKILYENNKCLVSSDLNNLIKFGLDNEDRQLLGVNNAVQY